MVGIFASVSVGICAMLSAGVRTPDELRYFRYISCLLSEATRCASTCTRRAKAACCCAPRRAAGICDSAVLPPAAGRRRSMPLPAPCGDVAAVLDRKKLMMTARHLVDCEHVRVGAVRVVDLVGVACGDEVMALAVLAPRRARPDRVGVVRAEYARADRERAALLERRAFAELDLSRGKPPALRRPLPDVDGQMERDVVCPLPSVVHDAQAI